MKDKKLIAFDLYDTCFALQEPNISYKKLFSDLGITERRRELKDILLTSHRSIEDILSDMLPDQKISTYLDVYYDMFCHEIWSTKVFPETLSVLSTLKARWYTLAAVSNIAQPYVQTLENLLPTLFHYKVLSCDVGIAKPDEKIFNHLKNISWFHSDEILMVGDSLYSDVQWAKNAHIDPVRIDRSSSWIRYHTDYISISTLTQLLQLL